MAPVIWGLDLAEIHYSKFKSSYMWSGDYHLRRTKFIVYQCALIFCVVSESLGTDVLSDYIQMERKIQTLTANRIKVYNNDYVGAGSYNIFAGVFVAFIFGAAFFFDLFWPERHESKSVRIAWKACGVLSVIFHLAAALTLTVITATHQSEIRGDHGRRTLPQHEVLQYWRLYTKHSEAPLIYRHNPRALAAVVFVWLGWISVLPSCVLLFLGIDNTEKGPGPKSKHARERDATAEHGPDADISREAEKESDLSSPDPASQELHHAGTDANVAPSEPTPPTTAPTTDGADDAPVTEYYDR